MKLKKQWSIIQHNYLSVFQKTFDLDQLESKSGTIMNQFLENQAPPVFQRILQDFLDNQAPVAGNA